MSASLYSSISIKKMANYYRGANAPLLLDMPPKNCDVETAFAFQQAGAEVVSVHAKQLIHRESRLSDYQIVVTPGGFTYGDDISGGKVLANEFGLKLGEDIARFVEGGGLILGICDSSGRVFALMPHPERHIRGTQHPQWTRQGAKEYGDGFQIFLNAVKWAESL